MNSLEFNYTSHANKFPSGVQNQLVNFDANKNGIFVLGKQNNSNTSIGIYFVL